MPCTCVQLAVGVDQRVRYNPLLQATNGTDQAEQTAARTEIQGAHIWDETDSLAKNRFIGREAMTALEEFLSTTDTDNNSVQAFAALLYCEDAWKNANTCWSVVTPTSA